MKRFAFALLALVMAASVFAQNDLQVLAVVKLNKNESVTVKQVKNRADMYQKTRNAAVSIDDRKKILESLIQEKLVLQAAQKSGITLTDSAVDQMFIENISTSLLGRVVSQPELEQIIQQQTKLSVDDFMKQNLGMSVSEYKTYLKNQAIVRQYVMRQRENEIKSVSPTDDEIRSFYELNKASFVWTDMLKLFMVVVPKGSEAEAARAKAADLNSKIKDKKYTTKQLSDEAKKDNSGFQCGEIIITKSQESTRQLGISYSDLLSLFSNPVGYVSNVTEFDTHFQFHTVVKKYDAKMLDLSDVVQPDSTNTVYDVIRAELRQQKQMQYFTVAARELAQELDVPENVDRKKTGDSLTKLLSW